MSKVFLAEDETELLKAETAILKINHYDVDSAVNGIEAEDKILHNAYDIIILDIMMPGKDGITVLQDIRKAGCTVPVIMLTAKSEVEDRINGLDNGADDYLSKPFEMKELLARIHSQLRRSSSYTPSILHYGDLTLNAAEETMVSSHSIRLSARETKLLQYLMQNAGRNLSTKEILEHVWSDDHNESEEAVYFYVSYLRDKLKAVGSHLEIIGSKGGSYHLTGEVS